MKSKSRGGGKIAKTKTSQLPNIKLTPFVKRKLLSMKLVEGETASSIVFRLINFYESQKIKQAVESKTPLLNTETPQFKASSFPAEVMLPRTYNQEMKGGNKQ